MSRLLSIAAAFCFSASLIAGPARAERGFTQGQVEQIRADAALAMSEARFESARALYESIILLIPGDAHALREAGRAAHALRDFAEAAKLLEKADEIAGKRDPELHYLLGEARWELGQKDAARRVHERAREELASAETRMELMWLARVHGRLGDRPAADEVYDALAAKAPRDAEIALAHAGMHAAARDWSEAEAAIRRFLVVWPTHRHALEMLAWILEAQGHVDRELELREALAKSGQAESVRDLGRARERAGDWAGALAAYRKASRLPGGRTDHLLTRALERMDHRMSIELAAGATAKSDPAATSIGGFTGMAMPFGRAHHLTLGAWHELVSADGREGSGSELWGGLSLRGRRSHALVGSRFGIIDFAHATTPGAAPISRKTSWTAPGGFASVGATLLGGHLQLGVDAELNTVWRETPRALLEGGRVDSVTSHLWGVGFKHKLVIDTGAQLRRLRLAEDGGGEPLTSQALLWTGADVVVWADYARQATGEVLDDDLLRPTFLADSVVLSYRHYELFAGSNDEFRLRMSMADRASIDELSFVARKALSRGRIAGELRGGIGHDWARELDIGRVGAALWLAPTQTSRLSVSFELAKESARALDGERRSSWVTYHVDL